METEERGRMGYLKLLLLVFVIAVGALTAVNLIPAEQIEPHLAYSEAILQEQLPEGQDKENADRRLWQLTSLRRDETYSAWHQALHYGGERSVYWNGFQAFLRPLLIVTNEARIRLCAGLAAAVMAAVLLTLVFLKRRLAAAVYVLLAEGAVGMLWYYCASAVGVPEYLMAAAGLGVGIRLVCLLQNKKDKDIWRLFALAGMLECFFTAGECFGLTLAVLLILLLMSRPGWMRLYRCAVTWFVSYVLFALLHAAVFTAATGTNGFALLWRYLF